MECSALVSENIGGDASEASSHVKFFSLTYFLAMFVVSKSPEDNSKDNLRFTLLPTQECNCVSDRVHLVYTGYHVCSSIGNASSTEIDIFGNIIPPIPVDILTILAE